MKKLIVLYIISIISILSLNAQTPSWYFINTGVENTHIVLVLPNTPITLDSVQMEEGDYAGAFYLFIDTLLCGTGTGNTGDIGGMIVSTSVTAATIWGAEPNVNNGFQNGEMFKWLVWRASDGSVFSAEATYDTSIPNIGDSCFYIANGLSKLESLTAFSIPGIDLSVNLQSQPLSGCGSQDEQPITVLLENHNTLDIIGFDVYYTINNGDTVSEFVNDTIFADSTYEYTFMQTVLFTDIGSYNFHVWVNYSGDVNYTNDYNNKEIIISELPVVDVGIDMTICFGDSMLFQTDSFYTEYIWNTGTISQYIYAQEEGIYYVTITDVLGCNASDSVYLTVLPLPDVGLGYEVEFCEGEYTNVTVYDRYQNLQWSNGSKKPNLYITYPGTYWLTVTDFAGCNGYDSIIATEIPQPIIDLGDDIFTTTPDSFILDAGEGYDSYIWSTGETTHEIIPEKFEIYEVTVFNGECYGSDEIRVFKLDTIGNIDTLRLFPNPTADILYATFPLSKTTTIEIYNSPGQFIERREYFSIYYAIIDLYHLHAGVYFIVVKSEEYSFTQRFIKL